MTTTPTKARVLFGLQVTGAEYIEETIWVWIANMDDSTFILARLKERRPFYHDGAVAEMKRRGIRTLKNGR